jgi:galactonate dehydratase
VRITDIKTQSVGAGWKNWIFVLVETDTGITGLGEATLNGFGRTVAAAVEELKHLAIGEDPRRVNALFERLLKSVSNEGGHLHRAAIAGVEIACWDIVGKSLGAPVHQLLGGRVRDTVRAYANGWYRAERTPEAFLAAARRPVEMGFNAIKLDPFGTAHGFIEEPELARSYEIVAAIRAEHPDLDVLIDVHARLTPTEAIRVAERFAGLDIYWWEEPTTRDREEPTNRVAARSPIRVASGETFFTTGQFLTLSQAAHVDIFQPEPITLGGIGQAMRVAALAATADAWIAPHQSGGPVATAVCLQLAACVPNFLIQEHFDPFNDDWTRDLVSWRPTLNKATGHLDLPQGPGLGLELDLDVARGHPYDPSAYLNTQQAGWEKRLGQASTG